MQVLFNVRSAVTNVLTEFLLGKELVLLAEPDRSSSTCKPFREQFRKWVVNVSYI